MSLNRGLNPNMIKTGLDEVFFSKFNEMPGPQLATVEDDSIFKQGVTDRGSIETEIMQDGGMWTQRANEEADLAEATIRSGFNKSHIVVNFAQDLPIPKHYIDDEKYGTVSESVRKMALKGRLTKFREGFGIYRNAFTTAVTNQGAAICSNAHTNLNGDTIDNLETAALSETSLNTMIQSLIEQVDQSGDNVGFEPYCLLVPNRLFKTAAEILESELRQGTGNNDMNVYSSKYGIMLKQSNWIGASNGGSDTAFFLLAKDHSIYRWVRQGIETEYVEHRFSSNFVSHYKAEYREVYGAISYEGIVGSNGTT